MSDAPLVVQSDRTILLEVDNPFTRRLGTPWPVLPNW